MYWVFNDGPYPVDAPLWFVRDLMVVILFAPLIYRILSRRWGGIAVLIIGVCWFLNAGFEIPGISSVSFFFFSTGAWLAIRGYDLTMIPHVVGRTAGIVYFIIALSALFFLSC